MDDQHFLLTGKRKHRDAASEQKWYVEGLNFECQRCGRCCRGEPGYVWVGEKEIEEISRYLGVGIDEFGRKYLRKSGGRYSLVELSNGDCIFYDGDCKIYPVRPTQCRTYPFWPSILRSEETWNELKKECPGADKGRLYSLAEITKLVDALT